MSVFKIGILIGSVATSSIDRKLAAALSRLAPSTLACREIPIRDLPIYNFDHEAEFPTVARAFKDAIADADAVLFVTPEYYRSIPGGLKNAIDWASRPYGENSFTHKPSAIIGASPSAIGSAIAQQQLRGILGACGSPVMTAPEAYIQFTPGLISDDGVVALGSIEDSLRHFMLEFGKFVERVATLNSTAPWRRQMFREREPGRDFPA